MVNSMATTPRIGTMIRRARERKRMRQQDLADTIGVSRTTVDAWENDRAYPRSSIGALEEVLGISLDGSGQESGPELIPADEWEAQVLSDPDLPDHLKRQLISDSRAARAAYRARKAARAASRGPGQAAG
jgi:transcriptional regulator with XRE-family HTH domain